MPVHHSLRGFTSSPTILYVALELHQQKAMEKSGRWTLALFALVILSLWPSEHLWRFTVFGAVIAAIQLFEGIIDMHARNCFMHSLTMHDVIESGAGKFGGANSIDSAMGTTERPA